MHIKKNIINICYSKIHLKVKYICVKDFFYEINMIKYFEENILNYLPTVMFRGTPCNRNDLIPI